MHLKDLDNETIKSLKLMRRRIRGYDVRVQEMAVLLNTKQFEFTPFSKDKSKISNDPSVQIGNLAREHK